MGSEKVFSCVKQEFNIGVAIVRIWMCFEVICCHFWKEGFPVFLKPLERARDLAVPLFMLTAFYLCADSIGRNLGKRLWRIVLPQIAWTVIIWLVENLCSIFDASRKVGFSDFGWQLFTGHSFNSPMWFQIILLILTVLYGSMVKINHNKIFICVFSGIMIIGAFYLEYSGIFFKSIDSLRSEIKYPLGRLIEMVPYAFGGVLLARSEVVEKVCAGKLGRLIELMFATAGFGVLFVLKRRTLWLNAPEGFNYQGIYLWGLSFALFVGAYVFPFGKIPKGLKDAIKFISGYTLGIYCIHVCIGRTINFCLDKLGIIKDSFIECIVIFLVCFIICWFLSKNKHLKRLVS